MELSVSWRSVSYCCAEINEAVAGFGNFDQRLECVWRRFSPKQRISMAPTKSSPWISGT